MKHPSLQENVPEVKKGASETVTDASRRLVWMQKDTWQMTGKWMNWVQVRDFAEQMNRNKFAGFANWRLPSVAEIKTLYDKSQHNKDHMGTEVPHCENYPPGFCFLCWTSDVRNKTQVARFGFRKGVIMYDDIYRTSRGSTRLVREMEKDEA
jgi:hypothetical protein